MKKVKKQKCKHSWVFMKERKISSHLDPDYYWYLFHCVNCLKVKAIEDEKIGV